MTIDELYNNTAKLNVQNIVTDSIDATKNKLRFLQRLQLLHGERSTGKKIGRYKNAHYAVMKFQQNPLAGMGYIDLRLTGAWYKDIFIEVRDGAVIFDSGNEKTDELFKKYNGETLLGLNVNYMSEYVESYLEPEAIKRITDALL